MRIFAWIALVLCWGAGARGQSAQAPVDGEYNYLRLRYEIRLGKHGSGAAQPLLRAEIAALADSLQALSGSKADAFNIAYLQNDNWEWASGSTADSKKPLLKHFYRKPSDLYHVKEERFDLHVNPVLYAGAGKDNNLASRTFMLARGFDIRGNIGKTVGFHTFATDNIVRFPQYAMGFGNGSRYSNIPSAQKEEALPQAGFWNPYRGDGAEFFRAWGHVSVQLMPEMSLQMGHGRQFVGHGYRSLILGDMAPAYFFTRFNTKVWKIRYTNIYASIAPKALKDSDRFTDKFYAFHHLALDVTQNFQIGIFENVVFSRGDTLRKWGFDANYLNPIIFLRAVEHNRASLDNVLLGFDAKWTVFKHIQLYGQIVLDEFKSSALFDNAGSYVNKYGLQGGFRWIDVAGIKNLDIQGEYNRVRPFTYTHSNRNIPNTASEGNYQHFGQPLAHPWGANFWEAIGIVRYQPLPKLQLVAKMIYGKMGEDEDGTNWGGNIMKPYDTATLLQGNSLLQGTLATLSYIDLTATWQLKHNIFIDAKQVFRRFDSTDDLRDNQTTFTSVALRMNIGQWLHEF